MVMNMEQEKFLQEGMDGKRFLLCLLKQWNKMAAAAAAGVVFTVAAYLCVMGLQKGETVYESLSNYYVYYNTDEKGNVKDYFNAYTWNDWMKADVMLDYVMPSLPEEISREEVKAAVRAECPSNAGWIYVYAEHTDPEKAERIGEAYVTALSDFAKNELGLSDIECWNREPVHEKKAEYKTVRAGIFGGVCGFLLAFFWLGFYYVMDDSFYLSEDIKKRLSLPLFGIHTAEKDADERWNRQLSDVLAYRFPDGGSIGMVCMEDILDRTAIEKLFRGAAAAYGKDETADASSEGTGQLPMLEYFFENALDASSYEKLRAKENVVLLLKWGNHNGRKAVWLTEQLALHNIVPAGVILTEGKGSFLRRYYGKRRDRV